MKASRRLPSLNVLRAFEVAARHLDFRLVAEEAGATRGAVAQMGRRLEGRRLEASPALKLFERNPQKRALTQAGRANAAKACEALAKAQRGH